MTLSPKQQQFIDAVQSGKNIFLTGKAGTGKSFVVKQAIEALQQSRKNVVAIAPTGVAANNIGGQTIHSMFSLTPYGILTYDECSYLKSEKRRLLNAIDCIFVDEVSMLRPDILDAMHWTLKKNNCRGLETRQIIFVGDLKQLPPVLDDNARSVLYQAYKGEEFFNASIYKSLQAEVIELDEVHRQTNEEFIHHLNIIREGGRSDYFRQFVHAQPEGIVLAPHNATVNAYNLAGLIANDGQEYVYEAVVTGNATADEFNVESLVKVKPGCKIMYLANSRNNNLVNGTLGTFVIENEMPFIDVNGVKYALEPLTFTKKQYVLNHHSNKLELMEIGSITQMPIRLAYALSIHKSQGLTFDVVTIDLTRPCFSRGQLYTALSRVRSPEGLRLIIERVTA